MLVSRTSCYRSGGKVFFGTFFFRGEVKNKTSQRRQKKELTKARRRLLIANFPLSAVSRRTTLDMQITSPSACESVYVSTCGHNAY